jgi:hypothetical protein
MSTNDASKTQPGPQPKASHPQTPKASRQRKPQTPRLKPKQALFVDFYTNPKSATFGNATQSARRAGYGPEYARKITAVMSENVSASMAEALDRAGLTDEAMATHHVQLLQLRSLHQISVDPEFTEAESRTMMDEQGYGFVALRKWVEYDKRGNERPKAIVLFTAPDGVSKKAALDMAYKLKRHYPADRLEHTGKDGSPLLIVRAEDAKPSEDAGNTNNPPAA